MEPNIRAWCLRGFWESCYAWKRKNGTDKSDIMGENYICAIGNAPLYGMEEG